MRIVEISPEPTAVKLFSETCKISSGALFVYSLEILTGFLQNKMLSSSSLSAMAIINSYLSFLMAFRSMISITDNLVATKNGENLIKSKYEMGRILRKAWITCGMLSIPMMTLSGFVPYLFNQTNLIDESDYEHIKEYIFPYLFAFPALLTIEPDISFLLTIQKQASIMKMIILPETLKVVFSYLLIHGNLNYSPGEMASIACANLLATWIGCLMLKMYLYFKFQKEYLFYSRDTKNENKYIKDIFRLGTPFYFEVLFSNGINLGLIFMIRALGKIDLSLYHVMNQWLSLYSPLIKSFIRGTKIKISESAGAQNLILLKKYAKNSFWVTSSLFCVPLVLFVTIPKKLATVFLDENDLNSLPANLPAIFTTALLGNFFLAQTDLLIANLSGLLKTKVPATITILTSLLTNLPIAYLLTQVADGGLLGINASFMITYGVNTLLLAKYWSSQTKELPVASVQGATPNQNEYTPIPDYSTGNEKTLSSVSFSSFFNSDPLPSSPSLPAVPATRKSIVERGLEKVSHCIIL